MQTHTTSDYTAAPVAASFPGVNPGFVPEFIRLPKPGSLCPYCGLSRSVLNTLILPSEKNGFKPPVRSLCLRKREERRVAKRGIRLIDYRSLMDYLRQQVAQEQGQVA